MSGTLEKYLTKLREATSEAGIYVYRGQEKAQWPLYSAATRRLVKAHGNEILQAPDFPDLYIKYHREELIEPARVSGFDVESGRKISDLQLLAKLQHFGAATGLLDFTWDPLVALYFASQDPECDGKLFVVDTSDPTHMTRVLSDEKNQDAAVVFSRADTSPRLAYWKPTLSGDAMSRILRQSSVFVIGRPLIPGDTGTVKEIIIAREDKESLLKDLELLNTSKLSLFQDLYGFAGANGAEASLPQIKDPSHYLLQGNQFYQQRDYSKAIKAYSTSIDLAPDAHNVGWTHFLRGNAKAASGNHEGSLEDFSEAINRQELILRSALYMVYFNRANSKAELKDYEGALRDYTKAIELGQNDPVLYLNRANTYADLGKFEEAVCDYDKAIAGCGQVSGTRLQHSYFNKGNALVSLGRFDEALRSYENARLNGIEGPGIDQNPWAVGEVLARIHGQGWEFEAPAETEVGPTVRIADHPGDIGGLLIVGRTGNTGNFGGGLPGGEGFGGKQGFLIYIKDRRREGE